MKIDGEEVERVELEKEVEGKVPGLAIKPKAPFVLFRAEGPMETTVEAVMDEKCSKVMFHLYAMVGLPRVDDYMRQMVVEHEAFSSNDVLGTGEDFLGQGMAYYVHLKVPPLQRRGEVIRGAREVCDKIFKSLSRILSAAIGLPQEN